MVFGRTAAIGVRYIQGRTAIPIVVSKAVGARATEAVASARELSIACFENAALADELAGKMQVGAGHPASKHSMASPGCFMPRCNRGVETPK